MVSHEQAQRAFLGAIGLPTEMFEVRTKGGVFQGIVVTSMGRPVRFFGKKLLKKLSRDPAFREAYAAVARGAGR